MIITIFADVDGTGSRTTCLLEIHGFLRWCQAWAHFVLRILVRWLEEPLVTMISRMVVFKMVYDTTIEVNEPSCPSEVRHPIIISHGANPIVRKFKFRFKFTTIFGSHKSFPHLSTRCQMSCSEEKTFSTGNHLPLVFTGTEKER